MGTLVCWFLLRCWSWIRGVWMKVCLMVLDRNISGFKSSLIGGGGRSLCSRVVPSLAEISLCFIRLWHAGYSSSTCMPSISILILSLFCGPDWSLSFGSSEFFGPFPSWFTSPMPPSYTHPWSFCILTTFTSFIISNQDFFCIWIFWFCLISSSYFDPTRSVRRDLFSFNHGPYIWCPGFSSDILTCPLHLCAVYPNLPHP